MHREYKHKNVRALEHLYKELPKDRRWFYRYQRCAAFLFSLFANAGLGLGAFWFVKNVIGREGEALSSCIPLILVSAFLGFFYVSAFSFRRINKKIRQEHVTLTGDDLELVAKARSGNPVSF